MGLFSDIFKYRERRSVTPIENFTTEIIKYLLKKYPQLIKSIFFKTLPDDIDFSTINPSLQKEKQERINT